MSSTGKLIQRMLKEHGFKLVRHGNHLVYRNSRGRILVTAASPSDAYHGERNSLADLRRVISA